MSKVVTGLQSEIFVPITPDPVWAPVEKSLDEMTIALVTAAGVHLESDKKFNLAGDFTYRVIPSSADSSELMVSHGGYDNGDVNKDVNCMFPIDRLKEISKEGIIGEISPIHIGFMGGGGDQEKFTNQTGPQIAEELNDHDVDAVLLTAG